MAKVKVTHTDVDKGRKRILKEFDNLSNSFVTVGVHENAQPYPSGQSVSFVATENEFGNKKIPERSFLRSTFDQNREEWRGEHRDLLKKVIVGRMDVLTALRRLGFTMATEVQNKIITLKVPANAPSTIKSKPLVGNNPLINTRRLLNSVGFQAVVPSAKGKDKVKKGGMK